LDCEYFRQLYINGGITGSYTCQGAPLPRPTASSAASATPTSTNPASSPGGGLSAGAKGGIIAAAVVVAGLAVFGIVIMIRRKHREKVGREMTTVAEMAVDNEPKNSEPRELPHDERYGRSELEVTPNEVAELHGDRGPLPDSRP